MIRLSVFYIWPVIILFLFPIVIVFFSKKAAPRKIKNLDAKYELSKHASTALWYFPVFIILFSIAIRAGSLYTYIPIFVILFTINFLSLYFLKINNGHRKNKLKTVKIYTLSLLNAIILSLAYMSQYDFNFSF